MTVEELIAELSKYPPTHQVIQSRDGEGNGYSPTADVTAAEYVPETKWSGEVWDVTRNPYNAVVLWPTR